MKKLSIFLLFVLILTFNFTNISFAANWSKVSETKNGDIVYFDVDSMIAYKEPVLSYTVWVKTEHTDNNAANLANRYGYDRPLKTSMEQYHYLPREYKARSLSVIEFASDGTPLYSESQDTKFMDIHPGSRYEIIFNISFPILVENAEKKQATFRQNFEL